MGSGARAWGGSRHADGGNFVLLILFTFLLVDRSASEADEESSGGAPAASCTTLPPALGKGKAAKRLLGKREASAPMPLQQRAAAGPVAPLHLHTQDTDVRKLDQ